jgi:hypothetical protein
MFSVNPRISSHALETLGSWRGVPGLGVTLIEFWEDYGNLAREVALVLCRPCLAPADSSPCASIKRSLRSRSATSHAIEQTPDGSGTGRVLEHVKHAPRVIGSILRLVNVKA